jgi:hypothetical protein
MQKHVQPQLSDRVKGEHHNRYAWKQRGGIQWLAFFLVLAIVVAGCSILPAMQAEQPEPQPGTVLFSDDFSRPPGGWGIWNREGALVDYYSGGLRIKVQEPQYDFWSVAGKTISDAQIEVDAIKLDGPDDNSFGLICRYQDRSNFYMLVASSDGYYGIAKLKEGRHSMIGSEQLQYSSAIIQGQALNRLRADCVGQRLSLYVNGQQLISVEDADFSAGDVGVLAGAYDVTDVDILFDNFMVIQPER